ncbi:hypothetical protein ACFX1S_006115 [Malus domestica]
MAFRFGRWEILREVRVVGSSPSSGNDSIIYSSHSENLICKCLRELGACSPSWGKPTNSGHPFIFKTSRDGNLDSTGNDLNSSHICMNSDRRDEREICISAGTDHKFLDLDIDISFKLAASSTPLPTKHTRFGQSDISNLRRDGSSIRKLLHPCKQARDSILTSCKLSCSSLGK